MTQGADDQEKPNIDHMAIVKRYWYLISATVALLLFEVILDVLQPWIMGLAIDGLIARDYGPLWTLIGVSLLALLIAFARRLFDTRAYGRIYREVALDVVSKDHAADRPVTQITARVGFVSEFTDFFEEMLPAALVSIVSLIGAVIMLSILSPVLAGATVGVTLCVGALFFFSRKRLTFLNGQLNNTMESKVSVLSQRDVLQARGLFQSIVRWRIALSDLEARNFGLVFLFTIILMALAVWVLVVHESRTEGQVFAGLTYILQFTQAVVVLPFTYQHFVRTQEISTRLNEAPEAEGEKNRVP